MLLIWGPCFEKLCSGQQSLGGLTARKQGSSWGPQVFMMSSMLAILSLKHARSTEHANRNVWKTVEPRLLTAAISPSGNRVAVVYGRLWKNSLSAEKRTDGLEHRQLCVCDGEEGGGEHKNL